VSENTYAVTQMVPLSLAVALLEEMALLSDNNLLRPTESARDFVMVQLAAALVEEMKRCGHWPPICTICAGVLLDGETCHVCGREGQGSRGL
jgi:hypothetical protein